MGNKFDMISANPSGSINNLNLLNETFHVFSKSPASDVTTLGGARLKSGHTTTASDVWADEIPAFFSAANQAKFDLFSTLAVKDDLCIFGGKVYQHNGTQFVNLGTEAEVLVDGATFQKNNKDVIKYHKNRTAINLTADNNNGDGSNNLSAKIYDAATGSTNFVSQFISSTDKMVAGVPSLAYDATVVADGVKLAEGLTNDNDYICNAYAGVIQFNKARSSGVTVSAWEYIGDKLTTSISDLRQSIKDISDVTLKGVVASVTADVNTAQKAGITVDNTVSTTPVIKVTTGSVASGETKLVTGGAVAAVTDALSGRVDSLTGTTTTGISEAKAAAKAAQDTADAKVASVTGPTTGLVTVSGDKTVTITVSDTIATKTDAATAASTAITTSLNGTTAGTIGAAVADAKKAGTDAASALNTAKNQTLAQTGTLSGMFSVTTAGTVGTGITGITISDTGLSTAIAAAKSGAEQTAATALSTARGEITTEISTAVSGLETKLTTGEGSLGAKVAALETATGTTLPAAIEQALTDAKAYADSKHTTSLDYVVLGDSESLPTASADTLGKIYLVASQNAPAADGSAISGSYVEYMTRKVSETEYTWEKIGTTAADLSAYAKTADLNATNVGSGAVKVSQTNGVVSSVTVTTEALVSNNAIKASVTNANALVKAGDALAAIKLAKPESYIKSVSATGMPGNIETLSGEVDLKLQAGFKRYDYTRSGFYADNFDKSIKLVPEFSYSNKLAETTFSNGKPQMFSGAVSVVKGEVWDRNDIDDMGMAYGEHLAGYFESHALSNGEDLFKHVGTLTRFESDLSLLKNGKGMFYETSLSSFVNDLPSLKTGDYMFSNGYSDGKAPVKLETFIGDLSGLYSGNRMFANSGLKHFLSDLSSLKWASDMFSGCSLTTESVECIADTISDQYSSWDITIDIENNEPNDREKVAFNTIHDKGWHLYVKGSLYTPTEPSAITTTDENGEVRTTPIPFYAKAVEVEEDRAEYIDANGKFYRVLGGQFIYVNDPETYGMFTCLEDAIANMRLTKYIKPETKPETEVKA